MTKITRKLTVLLILLFALVLLASAITAAAENGAQQRPIADFVERQGTFCIWDDGDSFGYEDPCPPGSILFVPPVGNFLGWSDPARELSASFDYAGLADACAGGAFGTEMSGHITERPLADGRAEVHVTLHTKNALAFVVGGYDYLADPLLFGQQLEEDPGYCGKLPDGTQAALGSSLLHLTFINTSPGAPLPDLIQLFFFTDDGQEPLKISFQGQADGLLAEGTPGRVKVTQTGLFMTNWMGATADGFPAENIILRAVGR